MKRVRPCLWMAFAVCYLALFGFAKPAHGQFVPAPDQAILIYAQTGQWSTELIVSTEAPSSVEYSNCVIDPRSVTVALPENGVARVKDFGKNQCGAAIGFVPVDLDFGVKAASVFTFDDGATSSHFVAPALFVGIEKDERRTIRRIISDDAQGTFMVLANVGPSPTTATLQVLDKNGALLGAEFVDLPVGVTAYTLKTPVDIGTVLITNGAAVGAPFIGESTIYGFAAVGPKDGRSQRVEIIE